MKKESDKQTIKKKKRKKGKKGEKDKESNSSRDSLELTIKSLQESNKMNENKTGEGEKIKFFFNEFPSNKVKRFQTASHKRLQNININIHKEKEEFDFKEILLNYVNQTGRTTNEKRTDRNERGSIIYTKPNEVLTLKSDNNTNKNNDEFSGKISESSSEYISKSKSLSESSSEKQTKKMEELNKKNKGNKNNNKIENNRKKKINDENKNKAILKNNIQNNNNNKKIIKSNDKKSKKGKQVTILSDKKMLNSEKNIESIINSNHNKFTNSNKIKFSMKNTFTTATNTQNSSFKSLQLDFKKLNYDYLNLSELSLKKKLIIQNRLNSEKKNIKKEIKENENMFDKIRNLNICLDVEKSYSNYFKSIINSQTQKNNNIKEINNNKIMKKDKRNSYDNKEYNKRYFYYPDEYYINKNSDLHSKLHVSNLFEQLRKKI